MNLILKKKKRSKDVRLLANCDVGVTVSDELSSLIFWSVKLSWTTLKMVVVSFSETSVSL
jgi:hypothetical protein